MGKKITVSPWDIFWNLIVQFEVDKYDKFRRFEVICRKCWKKKIVFLHIMKMAKTGCKCTMKQYEHKKWRVYKENEKKLITVFNGIKQRCNKSNLRCFKNYGGRWIKNEWNSFDEFYRDMIVWFKKWLVLDRINNNWNYSKENCRWITNIENQRNKSNNIIIEWITLPEFCEKYNLNYKLTVNRYCKLWWGIEKLKSHKLKTSISTNIDYPSTSKEWQKEYYKRKKDLHFKKYSYNDYEWKIQPCSLL